MISKPLAVGLLAAGCVSAAAGGAYMAVRQNAVVAESGITATASPAAETAPGTPVSETEAIITPPSATPEAPVSPQRVSAALPPPLPVEQPEPTPRRATAQARTARPAPVVERPAPAAPAPSAPSAATDLPPVVAPPLVTESRPEVPPGPQFEELVVPSASVIGLHVETSISSERARIEDRVDARVSRDVTIDGRVAIPSGSRAIGSVTAVDRGGKVKERARLGIRFHTLVLADGTELPMRTESVFREGEPPSGESARKIGGAAIGGAILGAIIGGGKGAVLGGATGAAGGTAVVMAGDRNAATLAAGTVVTVRLVAPITIQVEKQ